MTLKDGRLSVYRYSAAKMTDAAFIIGSTDRLMSIGTFGCNSVAASAALAIRNR